MKTNLITRIIHLEMREGEKKKSHMNRYFK